MVKNLSVKIKEAIPEPVFYLRGPATWDGRERIEISPDVANLAAMQAKGAGDLHYSWSVSGGAVIKEVAADRLILKRSQCSGKITVKLVLNNGGADYDASTSIVVNEPKTDPWLQRTPAKDPRPINSMPATITTKALWFTTAPSNSRQMPCFSNFTPTTS